MLPQEIRQRLRRFKKRYFVNRLIEGGIFFLLLGSLTSLAIVVMEGKWWLSPSTKKGLLIAYTALVGFLLLRYVLYPLYQLWTMDNHLSDEEAARWIGKHFPEIRDKLLNLVQLAQNPQQTALIVASIEQKTQEIKPYPIHLAIRFHKSLKKGRFLLIPLFIIALLWWLSPSLLTMGSYRLIHFNQTFTPPPPFTIHFKPFPKRLVQHQDFSLSLEVKGKQLPQRLFIFIRFEGQEQFTRYVLQKKDLRHFQFKLQNVTRSFDFYVGNLMHRSALFHVAVYPKPFVQWFQITVVPPAYTGLPAQKLEPLTGDVQVLRGSLLKWQVKPGNPTKTAYIKIGNRLLKPYKKDNDSYWFQHYAMQNQSYAMHLISPQAIKNNDTVQYQIQLLYDRYPSIDAYLESQPYVSLEGIVPVKVRASDDFGFSKLVIHYRISQSKDPNRIQSTFQQQVLERHFSNNFFEKRFLIDAFSLGMEEGDVIECYLEIFDNDYVSGPKSATSRVFHLYYSSALEQYDRHLQEQAASIENVDSLHQQLQEIEKSIEHYKAQLLTQQRLSFQQRKELQQLVKTQQQVIEQIQQLQETLQQRREEAQELFSEEIVEKYRKIEDFIESLDLEERQQLLQRLEELLQRNERFSMPELQKLQQSDEELKQQLEWLMEWLKQLHFEEKLETLLNKLSALEQKQQRLNEELNRLRPRKSHAQRWQQQQQDLKEQMQQMQKELQGLDSLAHPRFKESLEQLQQQSQQVEQFMQQGKEQLGNHQWNKAHQSQQNAIKGLRQMQQQMQSMISDLRMQQLMENYEDLRRILENLIELSFKQEELKQALQSGVNINSPRYWEVLRQQEQVRRSFQVIKDSLMALAKRNEEIASFIMERTKAVEKHLNKFIELTSTGNRYVQLLATEQHSAMREMNRLAEMLLESLESLQQQIRQGKQSKAMCKRPGSGMMGNLRQIIKMQRYLNDRLSELFKTQNELQRKGQKPSEKWGEQLRSLAQEQRRIHDDLQQLKDRLQRAGHKGLGDLDKVLEGMRKTEQELLDKRLTEATLKRQQRLLDRLLDYDKAMRTREFEQRRESQSAQQQRFLGKKDFLNSQPVEQSLRKTIYRRYYLKYVPYYQSLILLYQRNLVNQ